MDKKICVICADGIEEMELVVPVDIFRRSNIDVKLVSVENQLQVTSAHGIVIAADDGLKNISADDFDAIVVPGGPSSFKEYPLLVKVIKRFYEAGKLICSICAGPLFLHKAGVLNGKNFCCHPCIYDALPNVDKRSRIVVDENLITAKGPGVAAEFGLAIISYLCGNAASDSVKEEMFL